MSIYWQAYLLLMKPFEERRDNITTFLNEFMVSAYLYVLMCLTDFQGENHLREELGLVLIGILFLTVLGNLILAFIDIVKLLRQKCKYCKKNVQ